MLARIQSNHHLWHAVSMLLPLLPCAVHLLLLLLSGSRAAL
jgi:hypothetical protein